MSIAAEITTEPVKISPYTIGTGVPALLVFCTPLKLKETFGSSSELNSFGCSTGNNNWLTPPRTRAIPIFPAKAAKLNLPATVDQKQKPPPAIKPAPPDAIAKPIRAAPKRI